MKKEFVIITLILLSYLLFPAIFAQENISAQNKEELNLMPDFLNQNLEKLNQFFSDTQIELPENLQSFSQILFGTKEPISLKLFTILVAFWIIVFTIIYQGTSILAGSFESDFKVLGLSPSGVLIAGIMTAIGSSTGIMKTMAEVFIETAEKIKFMGQNAIITILLTTISLIIISYLITKFSSTIKKEKELIDAEERGQDIARLSAKAKASAELDNIKIR